MGWPQARLLTTLRRREARLAREAAEAEHWWILRGDRMNTRVYDRAQRKLEAVRSRIRAALPPLEAEEQADGKLLLVLYRDERTGRTDFCPYCGGRHSHGLSDGPKGAHCDVEGAEIHLSNGSVLRQRDGYVVRTRAAAGTNA